MLNGKKFQKRAKTKTKKNMSNAVLYHNMPVRDIELNLIQAPKTPGKIRLSQDREFKNPNHFENRTRNLKTAEGIKKNQHSIHN
jgi:hypothetical protein